MEHRAATSGSRHTFMALISTTDLERQGNLTLTETGEELADRQIPAVPTGAERRLGFALAQDTATGYFVGGATSTCARRARSSKRIECRQAVSQPTNPATRARAVADRDHARCGLPKPSAPASRRRASVRSATTPERRGHARAHRRRRDRRPDRRPRAAPGRLRRPRLRAGRRPARGGWGPLD